MILHTIGHSNLSIEDLVHVLKDHGVSYIVDVRSSPRSYRFPHFDRPELTAALEQADIGYLYMGDRLGGKPQQSSDEKEWKQGKLNPHLVSDLSRSDHWTKGIRTLASLLQERDGKQQAGCLLCSEGDANSCHRLLIAFDVLNSLPELTVNHIRPQTKRPEEIRFQKTLF